MYNIIKNVIINHSYTDLNKLLLKIKRIWIEESISEEQYNQLIQLALNNSPVKDYAVQEEIDKIWLAIREIQNRLNNEENNNQSGENETEPSASIPEFVQPTGAHDAYQIGDKVIYNNTIYESLINGNVWSPDVYPAGWTLIEE